MNKAFPEHASVQRHSSHVDTLIKALPPARHTQYITDAKKKQNIFPAWLSSDGFALINHKLMARRQRSQIAKSARAAGPAPICNTGPWMMDLLADNASAPFKRRKSAAGENNK